ncbi:MAG: hypothetical protein J6B98_03825 [Bacilli bacterium]|nr:hypothetical protein [Bacilli bacterium]
MKKNIVIIILSVLLLGSLIGIFMLSQNVTTCPECEVCMCDEKNCPKLEESDDWSKLAVGSYTQNIYAGGFNSNNKNGIKVDDIKVLDEVLKNNRDKDRIINDLKKYDLDNGTYILFESGMSGCSGDAPGIAEILIKDDLTILVKNKYKTSPGEETCMGYITNVYGIYIPLKINNYDIVD